MNRAAFLAIALTLLPPQCAKMLGQKAGPDPTVPPDPTPTPVPVTSATTPPVFTAVDTTPPPPSSSSPSAIPPGPDLAKARAAAEQKDWKKVKTLLEKKARAGKVSPEEAQLCYDACVQTKDKPCIDGIKSKYPTVKSDE